MKSSLFKLVTTFALGFGIAGSCMADEVKIRVINEWSVDCKLQEKHSQNKGWSDYKDVYRDEEANKGVVRAGSSKVIALEVTSSKEYLMVECGDNTEISNRHKGSDFNGKSKWTIGLGKSTLSDKIE